MMPKRILAFLSMSLIFVTCDFPLDGKKINLETLNGKVIVGVQELYERYDQPEDPKIAIVLRSEHIFGCINYHIEHQFQKKGNDLSLAILGASIGPICLTALGPATASLFPGLSSGAYRLSITMDGRTDDYELILTDAAIRLTARDTVVSRPEDGLVWRYPPQSFAYYCGTLTQDAWLCEAFNDTLKKYLALAEIQLPKTGRWPYPRASSGYYYDAPARFYRYATEANFDRAGALLKSFSKSFLKDRMGAGLSLVNWQNRYYYSWVLINQP